MIHHKHIQYAKFNILNISKIFNKLKIEVFMIFYLQIITIS